VLLGENVGTIAKVAVGAAAVAAGVHAVRRMKGE
jgi:F420-nonreducing hydrogenase I